MPSSQPDRRLDRISGEPAGSWRLFQLPDELLARVLAQLPPNDIACNVRLVCRDASAQLTGPQHTTVSVGNKLRPANEPELVVPAHAILGRWGHPGAGACLTYDHRRQLLCQAARTGNISNLDQLSCSLGCLVSKAVLFSAASAGQLNMCRWLLQHPDPPHRVADEPSHSSDLVREAVRSGNTELVSALLDMGYKLKVRDLHCAVESGNRAMCEWLASRGCPWAAKDDNRFGNQCRRRGIRRGRRRRRTRTRRRGRRSGRRLARARARAMWWMTGSVYLGGRRAGSSWPWTAATCTCSRRCMRGGCPWRGAAWCRRRRRGTWPWCSGSWRCRGDSRQAGRVAGSRVDARAAWGQASRSRRQGQRRALRAVKGRDWGSTSRGRAGSCGSGSSCCRC